MLNKIKRLIAVLSAVALAFCLCGCGEDDGEKYPSITEKFFVNDFAEVIDDESTEQMRFIGTDINTKIGAQLVVATVETTDGEEIEDYSLNLARNWAIGSKDEDNGVVIVLAVKDREVYVAVGYGLEGTLPDSKIGRIIDYYGLEYLSDGDFSKGITEIYTAVANEIYVEKGFPPVGEGEYIPAEELGKEDFTVVDFIIVGVIIFVIFITIVIVLKFGSKGGRGGRGGPFYGGFHTSSGGHRSSGSSFGGFSGGGGSFGGGGAGRGF